MYLLSVSTTFVRLTVAYVGSLLL